MIKSETMFELVLRIKKRPYMYLNNKKRMGDFSCCVLGYELGYHRCCRENDFSTSADNTHWKAFLAALCQKYAINSPWYHELIECCGSDETAYNAFMEECEAFLISLYGESEFREMYDKL